MVAATVGTALALTMMGAAGTGLGGLMVIIQPNMSFKRLGVLQVGPAGCVLMHLQN
jgi:ZIP family zinc transporter